ncbi:2Fe-2S iron-sulfur cluster-binding protein [uncultured Brevundimonas sp.]|uniref:2Fe-2S iron-sulfur cluster-binding protein n=1 Tax=uncultured Brevundimonas sp. TaxID=213418 RepID=UPI00261BDED6|nr:2Fe-2S iron-sulfur cluster-binding protein [uncultured Brevundimonas sp.]
MPFITFIQPDGSEQVVDADSGASLMAYATRDGVPGIEAECGGAMSCATCHVHVLPEWQAVTGPASDMERGMLDWRDNYAPAASRLSCQIILTDEMDGMKVAVPAED